MVHLLGSLVHKRGSPSESKVALSKQTFEDVQGRGILMNPIAGEYFGISQSFDLN